MRVGVSTFATDYAGDIAVLARRAEELGYDSIWVGEHPVLPLDISSAWPDEPDKGVPKVDAHIGDPFVALSRASAVTSTIKLGTGVCLVPEHNPLLLAKQVATLDMYSGGRFLFGIGAGWLKEASEIMGADFEHRWTQTREAVMAMKELWTSTESEFHGHYYDFPPVYMFPKPVQRPHPPILLGGNASRVLKRVVDYGDGWMPYQLATPEEMRDHCAELAELAGEAGRDPASIEVSYLCPPDYVDAMGALRDAGVDRVIFQLSTEVEASEAEGDVSRLESERLQMLSSTLR